MSKKKDNKKGAKKNSNDGADDKTIILKYMVDQNRPYNTKMVFENLHNAVKQADVTRIMEELAETGELVCKVNGKQKIFWANQDNIEGVTPEAGRELQEQINTLKSEYQEIKTTLGLQEKENKSLTNQLSNEELEKQLVILKEEVSKMETKVKQYKDKKVVSDPKLKENLIKKSKEYEAMWRKRKRITKEAADMLTEQSGMKLDKFYEDQGIETDESAGYCLNDLVDYTPKRSVPMKKKKGK
ncbi:Homologous-pairing protein 2-like protein [Entamoeba marina]